MQTSHARQSCKGFSLFELMIAIAIIGILAAIVIPNYQGSVRKANEASAVAALNTINFYYTDPENGICFSSIGPATASDDTL